MLNLKCFFVRYCLYCYLFLFFSVPSFSQTLVENNSSEVTLYLRSGEVIKGSFDQKAKDEVVIKKLGNRLAFNADDILRIEDSSGKITVPRKLPFKTAIVTYYWKGKKTGKEIVYIDALHNKIVIEDFTKTDSGDLNVPKEKREIYDGVNLIHLDMKAKKGILTKREGDVIANVFREDLYVGDVITRKTVLEKDCFMYEKENGSTAAFWKGILLNENQVNRINAAYNRSRTAVDIQQDVPLPVEKFGIPLDIVIQTNEDMMKDFEKMRSSAKKEEGIRK